MKTLPRLSLLATVMAVAGTFSTGALAATASGTANATVLTPMVITAGTALNFGTFSGNASGGTVKVATGTSARTLTGSVVVASGNTPTAGTFTVTGTGASTFGITYPANFNVTNPALNTMSVDVSAVTNSNPTTGTLASGTATLSVGGVLTVAANQAQGVYSGSYTMTVEYN